MVSHSQRRSARGAQPHLVTPLHLAARAGSLPCVRELLQAGADVSALDAAGQTPAEAAPAGEVADALREAAAGSKGLLSAPGGQAMA